MGWRLGQAYSRDLRDRVLAAVDEGRAVREVAPLFKVSIAYILQSAGVTPRDRGCNGTSARRHDTAQAGGA